MRISGMESSYHDSEENIMKKRVLILTNNDMGLYKFRRELISCLCWEYEVYICVPEGDFGEQLRSLGVELINCKMERRGMNPFHELSLLRRYKEIVRENKPDIVLTYTIKPNVYGGMVCKKRGVPYLPNVTGLGTTIENGGMLSRLTLLLYKMGLRKASCVFFQNEANQKLFLDKGIVKGKTQVIPGSGVNLLEHPLEDYPPLDGTIRFLFVGRIMRDKGIRELLAAVKAVREKGNSVSLDIVGAFDEDYENAVREAEKSEYIHYHGLQANVHPFIRNSHCLILPSYHEGMANVVLEAASTGRPVITTTVPGCWETFEEGITGFGCTPKSVSSLVEAINRFLQLDYEQMALMGKRGRAKVEKEFDRNIVVNSYLEQIKSVLGTSDE
jgi:galacturonosyltransferase